MAKKQENLVYDVFVSYASRDRAWIKKNLLPKLKQKGIKYCVDFRDFAAGKSAMGNMRDAVKNSRHTVLVMTPNWVKSEWTFFESLLSRGKDPAGIRQRTIPLLVKKCEVDDILSMLTWVNLTERGSKVTSWNQLYTALGKRPTQEQKRQIRKKRSANWHLAHPYAMPPNFTGRAVERVMLSQWLNEDDQHPLFILRALGGFGKSALSWFWLLHDADSTKWQKVVWWSFYEGDASFENFISKTLDYLKVEKPQGQRNQADKLLDVMKKENLLLVLDGFERALRAYANMNAAYQGDEATKDEGTERDCVNINAEVFLKNLSSFPAMKSKVLMTTRLTPRAVEKHGYKLDGCLEKELMAMDKGDAVKFFRSEGIRGTHAEIAEACAPYGFHPLSLRLLAGLIVSDLQTPGDIAVTKRLDISKDIIQNKHHVLEQAYNTMPKERQKLLSRIACFRSLVTYDALMSIATVDPQAIKKSKTKKKNQSSQSKASKPKKVIQTYENFDNDLRDLLVRSLLHHDIKTNRYDLHPIVRRYAYERLTAPDRTAAHTRLRDYFAAVEPPLRSRTLEELQPVVELYFHTLELEKVVEAAGLYLQKLDYSLYKLGANSIAIEILTRLFEKRLIENVPSQQFGWFAARMAWLHRQIGQYRNALIFTTLAESALVDHDIEELAHNFLEKSILQCQLGMLKLADQSSQKGIELLRDDSVGYLIRSYVLSIIGDVQGAEENLSKVFEFHDKSYLSSTNDILDALCSLIDVKILRFRLEKKVEYIDYALDVSKKIIQIAKDLEMLDELASPRTQVRTLLGLGKIYNIIQDSEKSESYLINALLKSRQIDQLEGETEVLLQVAYMRYEQKEYDEAIALAQDSLAIAERCGYVLQGADVNLFLAQYALEQEKDKAKAKEYAETALKLATCDGPPYYYKVAYEEAERMLEKLK